MKRLIAAIALLTFVAPAFGQTGSAKSAAQLNTEVSQFFPDQLAGQIIPYNTRQMLLDMIASGLSGPVSGTSCPVSSLAIYQMFANTTSAPTGTTINIFDGTQCVEWAVLNQTTHVMSANFGGTITTGANGGVSGEIIFNGSSSSNATIVVQAAAGGTTLTLPNASGTFAVSGTAPLALNNTSGALSITGSAGEVLAGASPAFTATPTLGKVGTGGSLTLAGSSSGSRAFAVNATGTTFTFGGGALSVAEGGTGDTGTAWASFTPSPSCGSATFTVNSSRSKTLGKTTFVEADISILTLGSCTTSLFFSLPNTANSGAGLVGRDSVSTGGGVTCFISTGTATGSCSSVNNLTGTSRVVVSGVYENQ